MGLLLVSAALDNTARLQGHNRGMRGAGVN